MLIPWNVESPRYAGYPHDRQYPWATIGLIVINIVAFLATGMGSDAGLATWGLRYGTGLHPLQWVTRNFIHAGLHHLIGNMFFLWVFGMVVEAKIGWRKFLAIYLGLAIFQAAVEQCWFDHGFSVGATGVIFALLGIALIWAPEHKIQCIWIFAGFTKAGAADIEVSVLWMAMWYVGTNLFYAALKNFQLSSEIEHSFGALLGAALAIAMLRLKWIDCEGWDLFTSVSGRFMKTKSRRTPHTIAPAMAGNFVSFDDASTSAEAALERFAQAQAYFRGLLATGNAAAALAVFEKTSRCAAHWKLAEKELLHLVDQLCHEKLYNEAVPFLEDYLRRFKKRTVQARLKLAQILIEHQQRPSYAARVLGDIPESPLPESYARLRIALERKAQRMIDDGVLELEGRAW